MTLISSAAKTNIAIHWTCCSACKKSPQSSNVIPLLSDYTRRILDGNQLHTQMLSIIDISMIVTKRTNSIATGLLDRRSLLDNPLICWTSDENLLRFSEAIVTSTVADILAYNICNNPIIQKYLTLSEQPHKKMSLCVLSSDAIAKILNTHAENEPFQPMQQSESQLEMGILENIHCTSRRGAYFTTDVHEYGSIKLCAGTRLTERTTRFRYNEMPASSSDIHDVTIEMAMFPFLFPHGHGHYNGEVGFSEYIKMRIGTLFSIYTLYKPYLLMMYQLKQAIMIANSTNNTMLQRDIDAYKKKNKGASFHDAIWNIVRYKLPSTMPGTPPWHCKNLKHLIAMVDMWGLPDFFLTFTADEVSVTRSNEIEVIETTLA
ncbi:hypothetical protein L7F22_033073 [Adiantum nelumboides]|nr:hypothetical protein [Adiantum nelumboides]